MASHALYPALDFPNVRHVLIEPVAIHWRKVFLETAHLLQNGIQQAA